MGPQVGPLWPFGSLWLSPWPLCIPKTSSWPFDPLDLLGPLKRPQGPRRPHGVPLVSHDDPFNPLGPLKRLPWPQCVPLPQRRPSWPLWTPWSLSSPPRTPHSSNLIPKDHTDVLFDPIGPPRWHPFLKVYHLDLSSEARYETQLHFSGTHPLSSQRANIVDLHF